MIRPATTSDYNQILEINQEWVHFLAPLNLTDFHDMRRMASDLLVVEKEKRIVAFLLVFREGSDYDSENYQWFSRRFSHGKRRFYYVDRIAIRGESQGQGIGGQLYEHLFDLAKENEVPIVCCEYNYQPLNEGSQIFHRKMQFKEVGRQELEGGKVVSLQQRDMN